MSYKMPRWQVIYNHSNMCQDIPCRAALIKKRDFVANLEAESSGTASGVVGIWIALLDVEIRRLVRLTRRVWQGYLNDDRTDNGNRNEVKGGKTSVTGDPLSYKWMLDADESRSRT